MLNVWVFTEVRRESGPPDLAFQAIVSLLTGMLGTEHASSGRAQGPSPPTLLLFHLFCVHVYAHTITCVLVSNLGELALPPPAAEAHTAGAF